MRGVSDTPPGDAHPSGRGRLTASGRLGGVVLAALLAGPPAGGRPAAAQWVEPPGSGWLALAVYHQDTREHFGTTGDVRPFFAGGRAVTTSTFLTSAVGVAPHLDLWTQFSFNRLRYNDITGDRGSVGLGDVRTWLRFAPLGWLGVDLPFAIRGGVKLPVGDFDVDAEIIPLGDGQRDWELMAEVGHSFWPRSLYLSGWAGYRWREENTESRKDFGDEFFYFLQLGGRLGPLGYRVALDGWDGAAGVTEGVRVPGFQRELVQLQPSVLYNVGSGQVEVGARFALRGRILPSGAALMAQYFRRWEPF